MPAKNTKCTNIWNFLTPLDSMHLAIFLEFFLIFNSNLKTHQILYWFGFFGSTTVTGRTDLYTEPNRLNYGFWFGIWIQPILVVSGWTGSVYRYRTTTVRPDWLGKNPAIKSSGTRGVLAWEFYTWCGGRSKWGIPEAPEPTNEDLPMKLMELPKSLGADV
jgi:hypothetical protein